MRMLITHDPQLITLAEALRGTKPAIPLVDTGAAFKKAAKEAPSRGSWTYRSLG